MQPLEAFDGAVSMLPTHDFWNRNAGLWDAISASQESYYAQRTKRVLNLILRNVPTAGAALDVGCGVGLLCYALQESGFEACGTDLSEEMIARARAHMQPFFPDPQDRFRVCAGDGFPFDAQFHLITAIGVFPYMADYEKFLRSLDAYLLPDGYIAASCTNRFSLYALLEATHYLMRVPRDRMAGTIVRNLLRTGVWSGGCVDYQAARQCYSTAAFDRLFRRFGYELTDQIDLFRTWECVLDRDSLCRSEPLRHLAALLGWNHIGVYRKMET